MKKLTKIRLILFLWTAVALLFMLSYYRLAMASNVRIIHKLAVVFWAVQGLIALAALVMSYKSAPTQDKNPE